MFERNDKPDDRAQVGIGTLIVFIAMVLVAAIAAGVLINTAGFLQSSAEESGEQAAEQVTNRLVVVDSVGDVKDDGSAVEKVDMTVRLAPGSENVNLNETTIQWVTDTGSFNLVSANVSDSGDAQFNWTTLRDDDDSINADDTLNAQTDRSILRFYSDSSLPGIAGGDNVTDGIDELDAGDTVDVTLNTRSGGSTTATLVVPQSLSGKDTVSL